MIKLLALDGRSFFLNPDLIYRIEATPDTVITLTDGKTLIVRETASAVVELIIAYRRKIYQHNWGGLDCEQAEKE
nr:flagellar FlbD family protein [Liquorilactobacillus satsumensis]